MAEFVTSVSTQTYDNLIAGTYPHLITAGVTIVSGAGELKRGTVLGKISASGKYTKSDSAQSDGSQVGSAILVSDVDAKSSDVKAEVFVSGMFNASALTFGGSDDRTKQEDNLRQYGIYLSDIH